MEIISATHLVCMHVQYSPQRMSCCGSQTALTHKVSYATLLQVTDYRILISSREKNR